MFPGVASSPGSVRPAAGSFSAIASLLLISSGTIPGRRPDILIEPEEIGRIVAALDNREPLPGRPRVGLADPCLALLAEEADVRTALTMAQGGGEVGDPGLIDRRLVGAPVERGDVHHDACAAV